MNWTIVVVVVGVAVGEMLSALWSPPWTIYFILGVGTVMAATITKKGKP